MEPTDLTVRLLQELRNGQKEQTKEMQEFRAEMREGREPARSRGMMMTRAVKVALESRTGNESRLDDLEKRLRALET